MKNKKFFQNLLKKYNIDATTFLASQGIAALFLGTYLMYKFMYKVEPGYLAIKFNLFSGVGSKVYREGYHLLLPFLERPIIYDCRMTNHTNTCMCGTKDLQIVTLKTRIICRPKIDKLPELYRLLGKDFEERALVSIVNEICGVSVSHFNASQIIAQRDNISYFIKQRITEKAKEYFIDVDDVAIIDIKFSPEFSDAIEKKQVAQQDAERVKFLVDQALEEKKATIISALGESEAVRKFGEANQSSDAYLTLRKLETAKVISKFLKNSKNKVLLDSNCFFMNIPMEKKIENKV